MNEAYVSLGANIGAREQALQEAVRRLGDDPDILLLRLSPLYETDPVGYTDQPAFLNMALSLETELPPVALLHRLLNVEKEMGRVRDIRWGPRVIDLDLLLYSDVILSGEELTLPHPRMGERAFVLAPLRDIWRGPSFPWTIPATEQQGIRLWGRLSDGLTGEGKELPRTC